MPTKASGLKKFAEYLSRGGGGSGERPVPKVLETESGLEDYAKQLSRLPKHDKGRQQGFAAIIAFFQALKRTPPEWVDEESDNLNNK